MKNLEELLKEAKKLKIKNAENLDVDSLTIAIDEKKDINAKAKLEAENKAKADNDAKAKLEAENKAKADEDAKAKLEAENKAKADEDAKAKLETENKAKADEDAKAKLEAENKAKADESTKSWSDANGTKWGFRKTAPESLNWDGEIRTQEDLLNDNSVMRKLTLGQYSFIKRLS